MLQQERSHGFQSLPHLRGSVVVSRVIYIASVARFYLTSPFFLHPQTVFCFPSFLKSDRLDRLEEKRGEEEESREDLDIVW
jgi:hypothetical protein